jgi:hypothetical protein
MLSADAIEVIRKSRKNRTAIFFITPPVASGD